MRSEQEHTHQLHEKLLDDIDDGIFLNQSLISIYLFICSLLLDVCLFSIESSREMCVHKRPEQSRDHDLHQTSSNTLATAGRRRCH